MKGMICKTVANIIIIIIFCLYFALSRRERFFNEIPDDFSKLKRKYILGNMLVLRAHVKFVFYSNLRFMR